jgi:hypothetical protein
MMNLFHADRLRKADDNPLPQQVQTPSPPEDICDARMNRAMHA